MVKRNMDQYLIFPDPIERKIRDDDHKMKLWNCLNGFKCSCLENEDVSSERLLLQNSCACLKAILDFRHSEKRRSIIAKRSYRSEYYHSTLVDYNENLYCGHLRFWAMSFPKLDTIWE